MTPPPPAHERTSPRPSLLGHGLALLVAVLLTFLAGALFPDGFTGVDQRLGDLAWRHAAQEQVEERVVVVDIDEASIQRLGSWPWPRERLAALSDRIAAQGARLQVYDIVPNTPQPQDPRLAAAFARNNAVLAQVFAIEQGEPVQSGQLSEGLISPACQPPMPEAYGYIAPAPLFSGLPGGHITPRVSRDGIVRQQPAYACIGQRAYPALALAAYLRGAGIDEAPRLVRGKGWMEPHWQLQIPGLARGIPLDRRGDLGIPYRIAPSGILAVSAADVLAERVPGDVFKDRWVLVGSTAFGLGDVVATPHGGALGGISVHVPLIAGLLDESLPYPPRAAAGLQLAAAAGALLALGGLLVVFRRRGLPAYAVPAAGAVLALGLLLGQAWAQVGPGWLVGMSQPALAVLLAGLLLGLTEWVQTRGERSRLFAHLASYLPAPVARRLVSQAPAADIIAERREVTVLIADIRNFSAFCEAYDAERAAGVLHGFLTSANEIVSANGGLIEAMQGDAILAVWNGSRPCPDHASLALCAAQALLARIERELPPGDDDNPAVPPLALGIGVESGPALVGSFGPSGQRVHTVLGKTVTVATRLQALTADLSWPILVGPGIVAQPGVSLPQGADLRRQGEFLLEGLTQASVVHALAPAVN